MFTSGIQWVIINIYSLLLYDQTIDWARPPESAIIYGETSLFRMQSPSLESSVMLWPGVYEGGGWRTYDVQREHIRPGDGWGRQGPVFCILSM